MLRHDSLAGKLLQIKSERGPVGASLLANVHLRQGLCCGTNRLQASFYKYKANGAL